MYVPTINSKGEIDTHNISEKEFKERHPQERVIRKRYDFRMYRGGPISPTDVTAETELYIPQDFQFMLGDDQIPEPDKQSIHMRPFVKVTVWISQQFKKDYPNRDEEIHRYIRRFAPWFFSYGERGMK